MPGCFFTARVPGLMSDSQSICSVGFKLALNNPLLLLCSRYYLVSLESCPDRHVPAFDSPMLCSVHTDRMLEREYRT